MIVIFGQFPLDFAINNFESGFDLSLLFWFLWACRPEGVIFNQVVMGFTWWFRKWLTCCSFELFENLIFLIWIKSWLLFNGEIWFATLKGVCYNRRGIFVRKVLLIWRPIIIVTILCGIWWGCRYLQAPIFRLSFNLLNQTIQLSCWT